MIYDDITKEELLLLRLCRLSFNESQKEEISDLVKTTTGWKHFAFLANEHGVAALIYNNLEKQDLLPFINPGEVMFLKESLMKSMTRNAFHTVVLSEVLGLLNKENIKVTLLKGMALELNEYGNTGLRQMTDIDILMARENCMKAMDILTANGFKYLPVKSALHKLIILDTGKHLPTLLRNGASVEIHHELFGKNRNRLSSVLSEKASPVRINDQTAYIPDPQLFFLYLARHIWFHEINIESQLRLYTDLVVLLENQRDRILTPDLLKYASESGMSEILAGKLELLRDMWGINFPDLVNEFIDEWHNPDSLPVFISFLKDPKRKPMSGGSGYYRHLIKDIPGFHRKLIFILGDIFPSITFMKKRYKCKSTLKAFLYYPHRAGKLIWLLKALFHS